jgi:uncharacterized protein (TIGR03663 family)
MNTKEVPGTFSGSGLSGAARKRFLAPFLCAGLLLGVTAGAAALRLVGLDNRPMHCDEGNQAVKFGLLLERGEYDYDPQEHHGPSLCFLTLPIAWLAGAEKLTELSEIHLRLLPGIFGIALVGMVWLLRNEMGYAAALCAAVLTAVSPTMVFFSRYYIQEALLVCFTFGAIVALRRSARHLTPQASEEPGHRPGTDAKRWSALVDTDRVWIRRAFWLVLLGFSVGMMHASKETCVIALFAIALAAAVALGDLRRAGWKRLLISGLIVSITAASLSALMFSSFLEKQEKKREAVIESYAAYSHYLKRASGEGSAGPHDQPWYHYFQRLFWWRSSSGPVWSEAAIAALALVGLVAGVWGRGLKPAHLPMVRFLGVYTVLMTVAYSAIPYKTPWCALGFLHGMILLAGVAAAVLVRAAPGYLLKGAVIAGLVATAGHLGWQAYRASFAAYEDPGNPYVYAHTTSDVPLLAERVKEIAALHPDGRAMHVQLICPDHDYWPLPWYLRELSRLDPSDKVPPRPAAPVIITQPKMGDAVLVYAYENHVPGEPIMRQSLPKDARPMVAPMVREVRLAVSQVATAGRGFMNTQVATAGRGFVNRAGADRRAVTASTVVATSRAGSCRIAWSISSGRRGRRPS